MLNDIISDSLSRIRNAGMRRLENTKLLHSKVVEALVRIFENKGYIESFDVIEEDKKKFISVVLKYDEQGKCVINEIKRVSKPGRRVYKGKEEIKRFKPSLDVDQIEDAIVKVDLTDMNDIMTGLIEEAIGQKKDERVR